jgi:hypothetical protein
VSWHRREQLLGRSELVDLFPTSLVTARKERKSPSKQKKMQSKTAELGSQSSYPDHFLGLVF